MLRMVDSQSGEPVEGMKVQGGFQREMWNAVSDADGKIAIKGTTGTSLFLNLDGSEIGYTRWWSEEAASDRERLQFPPTGIQWNFDNLTFDPPAEGEKQVTIYLENGVRMEGIVRDPDGKPVEGATVTPSVYGSGSPFSSYGHDRRFDATTDKAGRFRLLLPASHQVKMALTAHDGPYSARRTWANGVVGPFTTEPGETMNRLEIRLTSPAIIRGRVVTPEGTPPKVRQRVSAHGTDGAECAFVHPATYTNEEGYFELKHVRPGSTQVLVGSFSSPQNQPGSGNRVTVGANPDKPVEAVKLISREE